MVVTQTLVLRLSFLDEPWTTATGLFVQKFIDRIVVTTSERRTSLITTPAPMKTVSCIRYAETVLNWFEAKLLADFGGAAVTQADPISLSTPYVPSS